MAKDQMRYDQMVEEALRGVVRRALEEASQNGLPGNHHFYVTFRTGFDGVDIPDYLKERYPTEMTIVLQFQFYGLEVAQDTLHVTLSFNNVPERLHIPLAAITVFADPSVNFALQFQGSGQGQAAAAPETAPEPPKPPPAPPKKDGDGSGQVVSLDQFRRK